MDCERMKKWLKRYRKSLLCVARLERKLEDLDERMCAIKSPDYSGMPKGGGTPITIDDILHDKVELEKRIRKLKAKSEKYKAETLEVIDTLDDPVHSAILEGYLVDCLSLDAVAENEGYSVRHIYREYEKAVEVLTENSAKCQ